jgi:SAM-dependent methyltransferase
MANSEIIGAGQDTAHRAPKTKYPAILDACCGGRAFWFDKQNPDVLFVDRRVMQPEVVGKGIDARVRKCLPDVVMDFRCLDIPDRTFQLVVFDPPHLFLGENSYMGKCYGSLDKLTWRQDIRKGFSECFRVLKTGGILIFKWNECDVLLSEVLKCTDEKPLFGHPSGKSQKTHWLCFMKKGENMKTECDHSFVGNDYLCKKCGLYFPETNQESPVLGEESPAQNTMEICHTAPNSASTKCPRHNIENCLNCFDRS